jgi:hypothetical protein
MRLEHDPQRDDGDAAGQRQRRAAPARGIDPDSGRGTPVSVQGHDASISQPD